MNTSCTRLLLLSVAWALSATAQQATERDPSSASGSMADSLRAQIAEFHAIGIRALVVGSAEESGVALLDIHAAQDPGRPALVRAGSSLAVPLGGIPVRLTIASVSGDGIAIEAPSLDDKVVVPGGLRALPAPESPPEGVYLRHIECVDAPLGDVLRLIADQTGANIAATDQAARTPVTLALRNVSPVEAVSELCRSRALWFRRDTDSGILRVTTMAEYEGGVAALDEQVSECFTLLYPNAIEIASILYGLYPDRVLLSLGEDDILDSELNDLNRRAERFNALGNGQSSSLLSKTPGSLSATSSGSSLTGFKTGSGEATELRDNLRETRGQARLTSEEAARAPDAEAAMLAARRSASGIFVTISRRNNLLLVRTSDLQAMEDIRDLVRRIDVPTPTVLLEMRILNVALGDGYDADFLWSFTEEDSHGHAKRVSGRYPADVSVGDAVLGPSMNFSLIGRRFAASLEWLESQNRVTVVASPTLLVANNEISRIFRGQSRPLVKDISATATTSQYGTTTVSYDTDIEWNDVGTMIVVTPSINADRSVTLRLTHEESAVDAEKARIPVSVSGEGSSRIEYVDVDVLDSRSVSGTFVAQDGLPVAIGGLITETTEKVVKRVPFLGRIPLLGFLFRSTSLEKSRNELVILVTPHVISAPTDGAAISARVFDRISKAQAVLDEQAAEEAGDRKVQTYLPVRVAPQAPESAAPAELRTEGE